MEEGPDDAEDRARGRVRVTADLRRLVEVVCGQRFGGVPAGVAAALYQEENLLRLARWYIGAGSLSEAELVALVHAPERDT